MYRLSAWFFSVALITAASSTLAADWLTWRGPNRDGRALGITSPVKWPAKVKRIWQIEVGTGHASPIVKGNRVFLHSRQDDEETVRAVRLADGQELWRKSYAAPYKMHSSATGHGKGPKSTPTLADGRLFTLGISGIVTAWDAESGKRLWQHDYADRFKNTSPLYGTATSPIVDGNLLIAYVGGHDDGALIALDVKSGQMRWEYTDDGPGYASPVMATIGGRRQLITQSQEFTLGLDPSTGKLLWKIPYRTGYDQNSVTPLVVRDLVIIGGYRKGITAYRVAKSGGTWQPQQAWHTDRASMYMSSPVLSGGQFYGMSEKRSGQLFCLDVADGTERWLGDGRQGENATLLISGNVIYAVTTESELIVFRATAEKYEELGRYTVADDPVWAHPALTSRGILIKDEETLALWSLK